MRAKTASPMTDYELEVVPGLESWAAAEARERLRLSPEQVGAGREGRLSLRGIEVGKPVNELRTVVAAHRVEHFAIPRPQALLGHEHLTRLVRAAREVIGDSREEFKSFRISAAGSGSGVFVRLKDDLRKELGLFPTESEGDLLLGVRRGEGGWDVLLRTTPRPLSKRAWRVCDLPGALTGPVASVMAGLGGAGPRERYLNLVCGSATLLVERLELGPVGSAIGVDLSAAALSCAARNLDAAGLTSRVQLLRADVAALPLADAIADTIVADLPFGMLMGSDLDLPALYQAFLAEASRVAAPNAGLVAITSRRQLFEDTVRAQPSVWRFEQSQTVRLPFPGGTFSPTIFALRRFNS